LEKKRLRTKLQTARALHLARVPLLAGYEAPNPNVYPGFCLHDELELFVQAVSFAAGGAANSNYQSCAFFSTNLTNWEPSQRAN
jgi:hypothetical protein